MDTSIIRVAVDAREFAGPRRTGIARHVENLFAPLIAEPGLDLTFIGHTANWLPAKFRDPPARFMLIPPAPTVVADQFLMPRAAARAKAAVFFSPYYKIPLAGLFKRISTVHDVMFLRLPMLGPLRRALAAAQLRIAAARSDLVLVDSEFTRRDYLALTSAAANKTRVLYPGLEAAWAAELNPQSAEQTRARFACGRPFLLYVGNFKPHKNVELLVQSFLGLAARNAHGGRCLVLAGGDPVNATAIEALARTAPGPDLLRIHRDLSDEQLRSLYSAADWTVTLSSYEGFGYTVLEAMACGCPVLYYPCTSLPEVAGEAAVKIPALDQRSVEKALSDAIQMPSDSRAEYACLGRQQARLFMAGAGATAFKQMLADMFL